MAEQAGGEAGALALGPRVLCEDGGAAGRGALGAQRGPCTARSGAQLRSAAAERRRNGGGARIAGTGQTWSSELEAEKTN